MDQPRICFKKDTTFVAKDTEYEIKNAKHSPAEPEIQTNLETDREILHQDSKSTSACLIVSSIKPLSIGQRTVKLTQLS